MNGCIDEISIWNKARSSGEVRANWNAPLRGNESGLLGYWKFDDGTADDVTQEGHDGELMGDAAIITEKLPGFGGSRTVASIDAPGAFSIQNVPEGEDYFVSAFYDRNGNEARDPTEPYGEFEGNPFELIGDKAGIVINLFEPVSITTQPMAVVVQQGASPSLSVEASGEQPLSFVWMKDGVPLEDEAGRLTGTKSATLQFASITTDDAGGYSVTVSNVIGSVVSDVVAVSVAPDDIADGLVGYWKFDESAGETLADSSGFESAGTLFGFDNTDEERWVAGQIGGALDFEADLGNYVIVENYEMPTSAVSVSAWVNAESLSTWGSIIKTGAAASLGSFTLASTLLTETSATS